MTENLRDTNGSRLSLEKACRDPEAARAFLAPVIDEFTGNLRACIAHIRAHQKALQLPAFEAPERSFKYSERKEDLSNLPPVDGLDALSLDIFDTCLVRTLESPEDVFHVLGGFVEQKTGLAAEKFVRLRKEAEDQLRRKGLADGRREDTSLEAIYRFLSSELDWEDGIRNAVEEREVFLESCFLRPVGRMQEYIQAAGRAGVPIVYTSEMYLSGKHLSGILEKAGFPVRDVPVYASGEYGVSKGTGNLYRKVIADTGLNLTHVGDNPVSDVKMAESAGLNSVLVQTRKRVYPDILSNVLDTIATDEGERDAGNYWESLGYSVAGPVHFAFAVHLYRECRQRDLSNLHFLSRDGWFTIKVFEAIQDKWGPVVNPCYTYASREFLGLGSMTRIDSEEWDFLLKPSPLLRTRDLFERLGIPEAEYFPILRECGLPGKDERICHHWGFCDPDMRDRLYDAICRVLPSFLEYRDNLSTHLQMYLQQLELFDGKSAFVDLGWNGSSAGCLRKLAPEAGMAPAGFYFALLNSPSEGISGFFTEGGPRVDLLKGSIALMEFLFGSPEPTVKDMSWTSDVPKPVFRKPWGKRELLAWEGMKTGIDRFTQGCLTVLDQAPPGDGSAFVEDTLREFLFDPDAEDIEMLGALSHSEGWGTDNRIRLLPDRKAVRGDHLLREALCYCPWKPGLLQSM